MKQNSQIKRYDPQITAKIHSASKDACMKFIYALTCILYIASKAIPSLKTLKKLSLYLLYFTASCIFFAVLVVALMRAIDIEYGEQYSQSNEQIEVRN